MDQTWWDFRAELRISLTPVVTAFALTAGGVLLAVAPVRDLGRALVATSFAAFLGALAVGIHWLGKCKLQAGRWFAVLAAMAAVYLSQFWLGMPGSLALTVLPPLLAAALIGLKATTGVAAVETAAILWLANPARTGSEVGTVAGALLAIWGAASAMVAVYAPIYRVGDWVWKYYQQALRMIQEAQERQVELAQVVKDLAMANVQLVRLNDLAQGLRQAAEDARSAKERFVANVSHELRTPLNMITGFSEMILEAPQTYGRLPRRLLADLVVIHRNAEHLARLIDDVLDLSQLETDQVALVKEAIQIREIVEMATTAVRPLYASKKLYLETDIAPDLPPVFCDPTRIREVLLNLLSNAGRFTEQGGVRLRVWRQKGDLLVSVTDTGPGISDQNLRRLFQPFFQADSSIRRRYGGTGLGLSISKRFVELHGGAIWVESQEGVGTTFSFRIPLAPPPPPDPSVPFARGMMPGWEFLQRTRPYAGPSPVIRPRFVVLETDGLLQRLLSRYLEGVEIAAAADLEDAATQLARMPAQALIINSSAPGEDVSSLRANALLPAGIPVVACHIPAPGQAFSGRTRWLVKPVAREALLATLEELGVMSGTLLLVDDDPDALQLFGRMLASSGRGYKTLLATDGQQALAVLAERRPDAILLDLVMPGVDGWQILERRSRDSRLRDIPVAIVSAQDPVGQPIISSGLAVTQREGLSAFKLLRCIAALVSILSVGGRGDGPKVREAAPDGPVCA